MSDVCINTNWTDKSAFAINYAVRKAKPTDPKDLGVIKFGKSRPDKTKYVLLDIEYDDKAGEELFRAGLECLQCDKEAVINYVIVKAIKYTAELEKAKCKK